MNAVSFLFPTQRVFHTSACLIQGLIEVGCEVGTNTPLNISSVDSRGISTPKSVFEHDRVLVTQALTEGPLFVDLTYGPGEYTEHILRVMQQGRRVVIFNFADNCNFYDYPPELLSFVAHQNNNARRIGTFLPMGFGLSNDVIELSSKFMGHRRSGILSNFTPSLSQTVRNVLELTHVPRIPPEIELKFGQIPVDQYAEALAESLATLCYGGDLYKDLSCAPAFSHDKGYQFDYIADHPIVFRWDSWRFYEAAVFGSCPIHLDFDHYGMRLPVNPTLNRDYLAVRLEDPDGFHNFFRLLASDVEAELMGIGENARKWVIDNYSPLAMANYVMNQV